MFTIIPKTIEYISSLDQIVKLVKCNVGAGTNAFLLPLAITPYSLLFSI